MSSLKKVSIIMGIYNCEDILGESIDSIIAQTYTNWELIMCDDCSKDNTYEVAKKYEKKYPDKIKVLKNKKNLTLGPTLNRCLEITSGEYIARQDGDDKSVDTRIERQVRFLEENPEYDLVGTSMISYDGHNKKGARGIGIKEPTVKSLLKGTAFCHATIMTKKEVYTKLGGYSSKSYARRVEDLDLWFRFFKEGYRGYNIFEELYIVRDDGTEFDRRNFKNYYNDFRTRAAGFKMHKLKYINYIYLLKPIISFLLPRKLIINYQRRRVV